MPTRLAEQQSLFALEPAARRIAAPRRDLDPETAARILDAHDDYRVLRRVRPRALTGRRSLRDGEQLLIVLDTETTGLDCRRHEVIELGMLAVIHDAEGAIIGVAEEFNGLHEPAEPLPAGAQYLMAASATRAHPVSRVWKGDWQPTAASYISDWSHAAVWHGSCLCCLAAS